LIVSAVETLGTEDQEDPLTTQARYIHALGHAALTPLYDPLIALFMRERTFKLRLIEHLNLFPGARVLDVGSGTGTLTVLIKERHPQAEVAGLDGDPEIVARARRKVKQAGVPVTFHEGLATELPFPDGSLDRVTSSLVIHHLPTEAKARAFAEAHRVLKPGGEIHIADFGPPRSPIGRAIARLAEGFEQASDNLKGRLPQLLADAGFEGVREEDRVLTPIGPVVFLRGTRR
jgi:ubiquinone/menaquinone biosynthesis C-methylase UbiE